MTGAELAAAVEGVIAPYGRAVVAFSGGVDSSVVAVAAHRALGAGALAVTARSESNTAEDIALCRLVAESAGLAHEVLEYSELAIPNYAANPANRCYFCKNELYTRLGALAAGRGFQAVLDGSNVDDAGDYRPGLRAVSEHGVRSPLREAGLRKADVRALARHYGLPNHDRPAAPCLSSRIPYGQQVTAEKLRQVAESERFLHSLGFNELRCRHHGDLARLEVSPDDFPALMQKRAEIESHLKSLGFRWVALDLGGFRSGSLNEALRPTNPPSNGYGSG
ncbi:MAG: ATP-dependent sacrificial sulfur transferase LarE [Candidatus Sumerlaeia bacterium]|nr:ATP-dependent sacrificial sulfur transferase LarE [Candidatus Sumerlaeia bacterium]